MLVCDRVSPSTEKHTPRVFEVQDSVVLCRHPTDVYCQEGQGWVWQGLMHNDAESKSWAHLDSEVQSSVALCRDHEASRKLGHHVLGSIGHQQVGKDVVHEQSSGHVASITLDILHDTSTYQGARAPPG